MQTAGRHTGGWVFITCGQLYLVALNLMNPGLKVYALAQNTAKEF